MGLMKSGTRGEIVQVQGGHIVRSTGRKDRHSKVYTAKGPRDRRVRLSAHTAIEFYDVQDRLGYDRPSKAVDWLIKKAKSAIDKLAELPPWNPTDNNTSAEADRNVQGSNEIANTTGQSESSLYNFQLHENPDKNSSFIPPQYSDTIADPMKPFFPTSSATTSINFQNYAPDLFPRTSNSAQDLGLSLHSFQDHGLIHTQSQSDRNHTQPNDHNTLFASSGPVGYDTGSYQRMVEWNNETSVENRGEGDVNGGGFLFNSLPLTQEVLLGQGSGFAQRGTLQSSFSPLVRAWGDLTMPMPMPSSERTQILHQPSIFGTRFAFNGLPTFCFPTSIQCEVDKGEHSVVSKRLSSSSSPNSTRH